MIKKISFTATALIGLVFSQLGGICFAYQCPNMAGNDSIVNFIDFNSFASSWQQTGIGLKGDFDYSGTVDITDLAYFVGFWLTDGNCVQYYSAPLPYLTSFETYQQFYSWYDLDNQNGWQVNSGEAYIAAEEEYNWVYIDTNTTISKTFSSTGNDDRYIRFRIIAEQTAEIVVLSDSNIIGAVRFNSNGYIDVLNNGSYVGTSQMWNNDNWYEVKFVMNYDTDKYDVQWNGITIKSGALFNRNYDTLDEIEIRNGNYNWFGLDRISISDESGSGGQINTDIYITQPCGCDTDELTGRVTVTGKMWWDELGIYEIRFCAADPAIDPYDINNWHVADEGWNVVDAGGVLGYWDTSGIPNGYYYLGIVAYNDLGYAEQGLQVLTIELRYPDDTLVYSGWKTFAVVSELKCNTFYQEEQPDISVQWPGQFPFELKRIYNNNRRYYNKPLRNGWTHNNQIMLYEDSSYDWQKIDSGFWEGYPAYDDDLLAYGYIWVIYPDGSRKMFKHTSTALGETNPQYYPYPNDNSGEYIVRMSSFDDEWFIIEYMTYQLYTRDGMVLTFDTGYIDKSTLYPLSLYYGNRFDLIAAPIQGMTDRFGNALNFTWDSSKTAVTRVSSGNRAIEFNMVSGYYTEAKLKLGSNVYRTVKYDWDSANKIFTVTKTGYGVDANGVYNGATPKEYKTKYQYDSGLNLVKIAYDSNLANPSIEVSYDGYGRVAQRKDYVEPGNYLTTAFDYYFYHPDPWNNELSYLKTKSTTPFRDVNTLQDERGRVLEQKTITEYDSPATDVNALYNDLWQNPLKPTDINEYFDGFVRKTWKDYSSYGDLIEQRIYLDANHYVATELAYHPDYALETRQTTWQDVNKTGPKVEKLSIYGNANGSENIHGKYLVKEKQLLLQDSNVWAETKYVYNTNGLITKKTDPNNFITFYEYDANNYVKRITIGTADSNSPIQRFYNDAIGQRRIEAGYLGDVLLNDYDSFGRLWKVRKYKDPDVMTLSDAAFVPGRYEGMTAVSTIIYGYDENGNRTYQQLEAGGVIKTQYTTNGLEKKITYDDGSYIQNYYDGRGLKTEEYRYDANTARDWWVAQWYDDMDRTIQTVWYDYDDADIVKAETGDYWGSGKKKSQNTYGYGFAIEKQTDYHYDILGRLIRFVVDAPDLNLTTGYGYDAAGNRISVTDPNGNTIYYDYDNANRRIAEYFAVLPGTDPNEAILKKETTYYENGLTKDVNNYDYNDALLAHSRYEYDARHRIAKVTQDINESQQAVTCYDYNDAGFVYDSNLYQIRITDAENKNTYIKLDEFANKVKTVYSSGDYQWLEYNPDGTLKRKAVWDINDVNQWISYYYDSYARLCDVNYPDGGNVHYIYDGFRRKTATEDHRDLRDNIGGNSRIEYNYDVLNRLSQTTEHDGYVIEYGYRGDGQKNHIRVYEPNETQIYDVEYGYDTAGRLKTVREPILTGLEDYIAGFDYDKNGNRSKLEYFKTGNPMGSTIAMTYTYNACACACDNMLTGYTTTGGPTFSFDASNPGDIDGLGRLRHNTETITKTDGNTVNHEYNYSYDMLNRLRYYYTTNVPSSPTPHWEYIFDFDRAGNMTHRMFNNYSPNEQRHKWYYYTGDMRDYYEDDVGWTGEATFDKNGRQTSLLSNYSEYYPIEYDWDGRVRWNQSFTPGLGLEAKYTPEGIRIWKKRNWNLYSYTYKYIVDTTGEIPNILLVIDINDPNRHVVKTYIHANGQILAQHDGSYNAPRYFYLHDRLGSVRQIVDMNGDVVNSYFYLPYGDATGETQENIINWYTWAGYYAEDELDGYYCNARNYSGGRFLTRDPFEGDIQEPKTLHAYLYCFNDPVNKTDPTGEMAYWGAIERAKELKFGISAYYVTAYFMLGMVREPGDILDIAVGVNAAREGMFSKYGKYNTKSNKFMDVFADIVAPEDIKQPVEWECSEIEGFYRHCTASCRLNSIIRSPAVTMYEALEAGDDWPSKDWTINNMSDVIADFAGIAASYMTPVPLAGCRTMCAPMSKAMSYMVCPKKDK